MADSLAKPVVLVVDDEPGLRKVLSIALRRHGFTVETQPGVKRALQAIAERPQPYPLVFSDLVMPDGSGMKVLAAAKQRSTNTEVIMMTAFASVEGAIAAMRSGAYDFITKPFSPGELCELAKKALEKRGLRVENRKLKAKLASITQSDGDPGLFGNDPAMQKVANLVERVAGTRTTVLMTGESGTGKEHAARILHQLSGREGEFCVINCGALPENLMESELFGHEKGAFTGAATAALGLFRQADKGTLLLDEIGELPLSLQVKLLRVLQERKVRPVGSSREVAVDVRVMAATNRDVEADVESGRFRRDLYYRLNIIRIELPPLRQRRTDIARLAKLSLRRFASEFDKPIERIDDDALRRLCSYRFPGNIRELENIIERAVALSLDSVIKLEDLPDEVAQQPKPPVTIATDLPEQGCQLDEVLEGTERRLLTQALDRCGGVRKHAAKLLGISFRSMRYRLSKLQMEMEIEAVDAETSSHSVVPSAGVDPSLD